MILISLVEVVVNKYKKKLLKRNVIYMIITFEETINTESIRDHGFLTLRGKLFSTLKGDCNITNVKNVYGKETFDITTNISDEEIKVSVTATPSGCEVLGRTNHNGLVHWRNVALSRAYDRILSIFQNPKEVFSESNRKKYTNRTRRHTK